MADGPGRLAAAGHVGDSEAPDEPQRLHIKNPNKIRAVINTFAAANPGNFHAEDGSGYVFLADQILVINEFNPLAAARMVPPLDRWRRFDAGRQALMKAQLERLSKAPGLSPDVYELVMKSLAA